MAVIFPSLISDPGQMDEKRKNDQKSRKTLLFGYEKPLSQFSKLVISPILPAYQKLVIKTMEKPFDHALFASQSLEFYPTKGKYNIHQ